MAKGLTIENVKAAAIDFWDGTVKDEKGQVKENYSFLENCRISHRGIRKCIDRATVDITVRTLTPDHDGVNNESEAWMKTFANKISTDGKLLQNILDWLNSATTATYSDWHDKACTDALIVIRRYYKCKYTGKPVHYGKAQKVVNMAMKTIYCLLCRESEEVFNRYNPRFDDCHIPLDSYTMQWFYQLKKAKLTLDGRKYVKTNCPDWSNFDSENELERDASKYTYQFIVNEIADLFLHSGDAQADYRSLHGHVESEYEMLTPLQAEFFIWKKSQMLELTHNLGALLKKYAQNVDVIKVYAATDPKWQADIDQIRKLCRQLQ